MAKSVRELLKENLKRFQEARPDELGSTPKLAAASKGGISQRTAARAVDGDNIKTDSLQGLARACGVEPWQLLVENLNPAKPPKLSVGDDLVPDEENLLRTYRDATPQWRTAIQNFAALHREQQDWVLKQLLAVLFQPAVPDDRLSDKWRNPDSPPSKQ